jgi:hypothetical protein
MCFEKKIIGVAIEKRSESIIVLISKMYTRFNENVTVKTTYKGYRGAASKLAHSDYNKDYSERTTLTRTNNNFQPHNNITSRVRITKNILTAAYTKYKVSEYFSTCIPLFYNVA